MTAAAFDAKEFVREAGAHRAEPNEPPPDIGALALEWAALTGKTPPPRAFAWNPWIPARTTTLLNGFGGSGKTLLGQQICSAYALGVSLFGGATEGRPALLIAGEDDHDEIWRRQVDICSYFGVALDELAGRVRILPVPHIDVTLAQQSLSGTIVKTSMLDTVLGEIKAFAPGLVMLDNASKMFAINENDRTAVTRAVGFLNAIAHDFDVAVLLLSHNNKVGEFSGSTAWENAVRSRLSLARDQETGAVTLARPKANYSDNGEVTLRWRAGAFSCETESAMTQGERIATEIERRKYVEVFLGALDTLNAQHRAVSHSRQASNYAGRVMRESGLVNGMSERQVKDTMELLFKEGRLVAGAQLWQKSDRHWAFGLGRK